MTDHSVHSSHVPGGNKLVFRDHGFSRQFVRINNGRGQRESALRYTARMISVGSHPAWHPVFEALGYLTGYAVFRSARIRQGDVVEDPQRWTVIAAAAVGALIGSRVLGLAEQWPTVLPAIRSGGFLTLLLASGGKTIVGGLLGGWIAVELTKRFSGIRSRTGDLFVLPLCVGIAVGRIGCFVAGLADDTYGTATKLPWAVNFGDGVPRHPTQLYEIAFLAILSFFLTRPVNWPDGYRFRLFMAGYLGWRLAIDFLKPQPVVAGMNVIQWACVAGLLVLATLFFLDLTARRKETHERAFA
jgi:phosphatidylglycerol---prolipoprotein diacylglyceryl transferase